MTDYSKPEPLWLRVATVIVVAALLAVILWVAQVAAAPIYEAQRGPVKVVLHSDPCTLPAVVNLPGRAEWIEGETRFEGCWAAHGGAGVVIAYFSDRTIVLIPSHIFERVTTT